MRLLNQRTRLLTLGLASLALVLFMVIPMTLGLLTSKPDPLVNLFTDPYVPPSITEVFDGETKDNIQVKNEGNVNAYIRLALVIQAKSEGGQILAYKPLPGTDYSMSAMDPDWFLDGGYYYYKHKVAPGAYTTVLFSEIKALKIPLKLVDGVPYYLNVDVVAQSIQAEPPEAVQEAWPAMVSP